MSPGPPVRGLALAGFDMAAAQEAPGTAGTAGTAQGNMKGLVKEAMARRAAVVTAYWRPGGLVVPPWLHPAGQCPAGQSATDAAVRAVLRPPDEPRGRDKSRQRGFPYLGYRPARRKRLYWGCRRPSSAPPEATDFDYVVREQQQARVAFGSAQSRTVMPVTGLGAGASRMAASIARRATDGLGDLGPGAYTAANLGALHDILTKVISKRGVGPGARTAARFKEVDQHLPAPNAYDLDYRGRCHCPAPNRAPFNTTTYRKSLVTSNTPGPGSYTPGSFSAPGVAVSVLCSAGEGPGRCESCLQDVTVGTEFWALESPVQGLPKGTVLCQACMLAARKRTPGEVARFARWQLDAFKKSRDCSDIHRHEGTRAKIFLVDPKTVVKRRRKEAYLAKYFRDHVAVDPDLTPGSEPAMLTEQDEEVSRRDVRRDEFCCVHEAFNSLNRDNMSFGLRVPSELIYNTIKRCALDFHPSVSLSGGSARLPSDLIYNSCKKCALDFRPSVSLSGASARPPSDLIYNSCKKCALDFRPSVSLSGASARPRHSLTESTTSSTRASSRPERRASGP